MEKRVVWYGDFHFDSCSIEKTSHFKALLHFCHALYNTGIVLIVFCLIESFHLSTRSPILDNFKFWYRLSLIELNS